MSCWNETLGAALDAASGPVPFHFFAIDRGRDPDGTRRLVDLFAECAVPLDLALVPQALDDGLAAWLRPRLCLHSLC